jgi:hypothetical protein
MKKPKPALTRLNVTLDMVRATEITRDIADPRESPELPRKGASVRVASAHLNEDHMIELELNGERYDLEEFIKQWKLDGARLSE